MRPGRDYKEELIFAATAAAAALALPWPALARGEGLLPVGSLWRFPPWNAVLPPGPGNGLLVDQLLNFWPWRLFLRAELLSGHFPFWNPLIAGGVPFVACVQAAPFFPTNLLLPFLSPAAWSVAAAFLKVFAAGFFTSLHARGLGAGRSGAALAGISFALCGFMVAWLGHPQTNAACLLPALFWALGRGMERGTARGWVPASLVVALILLGGHPPTALHILAAGAAYVFFLRRDRLPAAGWAALAGAGLAAPALLPYFEYLSLSSTAASSASLARWATRLSPWSLLHLMMPLASGSPTRGAEVLAGVFGLGPESNFLERAGWVGLPALAFAALALTRRRDRQTLFHAGLAAFGLAAALGAPPLPQLWRVLPAFSAANPTRLLLLFCFGASTLAGLGCEGEPAPARFRGWALAAFGAVLLLDLFRVGRVWSALTPGEQGFALAQAAAFAVEAAVALWLLARPRARIWAPLIAALFLLRAGVGVNPAAPAELLYPRTAGIEALSAEQGSGRVFGLGWALAPDLGMAAGLRDARGRDFTTLRRYEELVSGRAGDFDFYSGASALPPSPALLALSAVAATEKTAAAIPSDWEQVHNGDLLVFRAPSPGRRALFVPQARSAPSAAVLAAVRAPGFDPSRIAWLDDGDPPIEGTEAHGTAKIAREDSDEVVVDVRSDGPGWLLLLDNWYPGWRAEINSAPAAVRRADYTFRAVAVPAGRSTVRFTYVSLPFRIGLALAALSALALAAVPFLFRS